MKIYKLEDESARRKYVGRCGQYYSKKLRAMVDGKEFNLPAPGKDWKE
jgi:hypothetical protein